MLAAPQQLATIILIWLKKMVVCSLSHPALTLCLYFSVFVQATVDGGSETEELYAAHVALR
jgi:hypothetical protein